MNRCARKNFITAKEKIILHLLNYQRYVNDPAAPEVVTQEGIARTIEVGRNNVSRYLRELIVDNLVIEQQKHVKGMRRIRKVYFLSHLGFNEAMKLKGEIESTKIQIIDFEGNEIVDEVGRLNLYLPHSYSLVELAGSIQNGVFNCASFHERRIKMERRYIDYTDRKPAVRVFFGRDKELEDLHSFLQKDKARILVVYGIPGIGKTTLLAKFAQEVRDRTNLFWYRLHEWVTLKTLLSPLAEFLSQMGKRGLERYLDQNAIPVIGEVCAILEKDLVDLDALIIMDDVQKAESSVREFLTAVVATMGQLSRVKIVVASREIPAFYSRTDVINGTVEEICLEGLDFDSAKQLLTIRSVPSDSIETIYKATGGHPLFMQLISDPDSVLDVNVRRFLEQEVYQKLEISERRIMEIASVFRYPVPVDAMFFLEEEIYKQLGQNLEHTGYGDYLIDYDIIDGLMAKSLLQESTGRLIGVHDLIRDFFYNRLKPRQKIIFHRAAAKFYLEEQSPSSLIEALYHSLKANDLDMAVSIAAGHGRRVISEGYVAPFAPLLSELISRQPDTDQKDLIEILLLQGEIYDIQGNWDQAIECYEKVLSMVSGQSDRNVLAEVHRRLGSILLRKAEFDDAVSHLETARSIASEISDTHTLAEIYYDMGGVAERTGRFEESIELFKKSGDLAEMVGNDIAVGKALYGIGRVYSSLLKYEMAIDYKKRALRILEKIGEAREIAKVCTSLGNDFMAIGDMVSALKYQGKAINEAKSSGDISTLGYAFSNAAAVYLEMNILEESAQLINEADSIFSKIDDKIMMSTMHLYRGYIYHKQNDWEWAKAEFNKSLEMLRGLGVPLKLSYWLFEVGKLYLENNDADGALKLFKEAREIADRMRHENLVRDLEKAMNIART